MITVAFHRTILGGGRAARCRPGIDRRWSEPGRHQPVGDHCGGLRRLSSCSRSFLPSRGFGTWGRLSGIGGPSGGDRLERGPDDDTLPLPSAEISPAGYIVMQHAVRAGRPVQAYQKWMRRIPGVYHDVVLDEAGEPASSTDDDRECLSTLKHYRSLMPMAQEARKPIFHLKAADGALGGHIYAVQDCCEDFKALAMSIAAKCHVSVIRPRRIRI